MASKWKPGDVVRLKGHLKPRMVVRGPSNNNPSHVDCDWQDSKGNDKQKDYHEDQLEVSEDDDDFLPITRG